MVNKIDFGEFILNTAITNSATLASLNVTARYTEHDLTKDRATGLLTSGKVTITNPNDLGQKESFYFSNATADGTDSLSRNKYILTIGTADDASTKRRGIANDDDGTDAVANVISGNMYAFPKNSPVRITWEVGELTALESTFTAGTTVNTAEAGEDIEALDSVSLHTDGKLYEYHATNYPNLVGAVSSAYSTGATATYTTFGGVSTGHSGLTVGATQYAENTGTITETSSTTTTILGTAESATTIRIAKAGESVTEFSDTDFKIKDDGDATKIAAFQASGITTATTRTYTLPDSDGTILTSGTADVPDNVLNIVDNGDNTKKIAFQASGITTATTRTITMPDRDVDLDDITGQGLEFSTIFETTGRFTKATLGAAGHSFGASGLVSNSGTTVNGQSRTSLGGSNTAASIVNGTGTTVVSMIITPDNFATDLSNIFIGVSRDNTTTGNTMFDDAGSNKAFGFLFRQTSSALNLYGLSRDSSTTTELLQTFTNASRYLLTMVRHGDSSIDFYVNGTNQGTITTNIATTFTTNEYLFYANANNPSPSTDDVEATVESYSLKYTI